MHFVRFPSPDREFIKADRDRLAKIHGGLPRVGRDRDEKVAIRQVIAGEPVLLRPEDESDAARRSKCLSCSRGKLRQGKNRLLGFAVFERPGARDQRALGNCFGKRSALARIQEQLRRADRRPCLPPVRRIRRNHSQPCEAEVGHGPRRRTDVERVAWAYQDDVDAVAMGLSEQEDIVEKPAQSDLVAVDTLGAIVVGDPRFLQSAGGSSDAEIEALCAAARWCFTRGWAPATSGNFSVRPYDDSGRILITPSGLDKGTLMPADLLEVDTEGRAVAGKGKPSAETGLHLVVYRRRPALRSILHVHTVWNTLISGRFAAAGATPGHIPIQGYEILKGLSGVATHEHVEQVPLLANTQNYVELCAKLNAALEQYPAAHGVLLDRHGLYTWGESVAEARRHLEVLEFLFEIEMRRLAGDRFA
jgi:methylthioribulose-1-phosphate dehydratase